MSQSKKANSIKVIEQRLAKLEQAGATVGMVYAWAEAEETTEQAIVRQFPAGRAEKATVMVFRWSE